MRIWMSAILIFFLIPLASALDECQRTEEPRNIPCTIYSTYYPTGGCAADISIYLENGSLIQIQTWGENTPFCNSTWNITTTGSYTYNSTIENGAITIRQVDDMTSLSVTIFILLINIALFIFPAFVRFTPNEVLNNLMTKMMWLAGLLFLAFNTTIIVTLSEKAGLGVSKELFTYQYLFLWGVYAGMVFLFFNIITSTMKLWKVQKTKKRMGENDE